MENGFSGFRIRLVAEHEQRQLINRKICIGAEHTRNGTELPVRKSAITEINKSDSQLDLSIFTNDQPVPTLVSRAV